MKKPILPFLVLILLSFNVLSQNEQKQVPKDTIKTYLFTFKGSKQNLTFGLKGGWDLTKIFETESNIPSEVNVNNYPIPGRKFYVNNFQAGFLIDYQIKKRFGISIEPGFIQKGTDFNNPEGTQVRLGYISSPITFYYLPFPWLKLEIGPEFDYRIYKKIANNSIFSDEEMMKNNFDLNMLGGISFNVFKFLNVGGRYSLSLTHMTSDLIYSDKYYNIYGTQHVYDYNRYVELYIRFYWIRK